MSNDFVKCEICKKNFKSITYKHLVNHSITLSDYKEKYPNSKMISDLTSAKYNTASKSSFPHYRTRGME